MVIKVEYKASKGSVGVESFQERLRLRLPRHLYNGKVTTTKRNMLADTSIISNSTQVYPKY